MGISSGGADQDPDEEDAGEEGDGGVCPTPADKPTAGGGKVLRKGGAEGSGREEGVAERGQGTCDADNHDYDNADQGTEGGYQADVAAQKAFATAEKVGGEGDGGKQQESIGEVQRKERWPHGRLALRGVTQLNQKGAEDGFNQREGYRGHGKGAGEVAARGAEERPNQQTHDPEERQAAGDAVGEFDEGVEAGGVLQHSAVTERPVVAASGPGAGGADKGSPENDGDEISKNSPGKATQGGRGKQSCIHGKGGCGHEGSLRMEQTSVEQRTEPL